jgi:biotin synthase
MGNEGFLELKNAGLKRYHHNLETSRNFFSSICTTHTYDERIATVLAAREAGLEVCSGGIFGMGETWQDRLEMAIDLKKLGVDAVPVNFLVPIRGTPLENRKSLRPSECLKIISLFRYVLPDKEIIVCAGRESVIGSFQNMCMWAGATGLMTGNYLTVSGPETDRDIAMIRREGFQIKEKSHKH